MDYENVRKVLYQEIYDNTYHVLDLIEYAQYNPIFREDSISSLWYDIKIVKAMILTYSAYITTNEFERFKQEKHIKKYLKKVKKFKKRVKEDKN